MDPFIEANPEWCLEQGIITKEEYDAIVNPAAPEEMQTEPAPVEETITIDGKTYTKSELKKLLE